MNVRGIVEQWLRQHGYDGLCTEDCYCELNDLMPCGESGTYCEPGYKVPCPGPEKCPLGGDCTFHMSPVKRN